MLRRITVCLLLASLVGIAQAEEKNYIEPTPKTPTWQDAQDQSELNQTRTAKNVRFSEGPSLPGKTRNIAGDGSNDDVDQSRGYNCSNRRGN